MRGAILVISTCLVLACAYGYRQYQIIETDFVATQDVVLGLLYFMEAHDGRFPESEQEFRASLTVQERSDGTLQIRAPESTQFSKAPHGRAIADLSVFKIAWGASFEGLVVNEYGRVRDADGKAVEFVSMPNGPASGKGYAAFLLNQHQALAPTVETSDDAAAGTP